MTMIVRKRRLGLGVFVQSSAAWKTDCDSILQKKHQKQTHVTLTLTQQDHDTYLECTCHLNIDLCTPFQPLEYEYKNIYIVHLPLSETIYTYIYISMRCVDSCQSFGSAAKHKRPQEVLQSTRGAAKHKRCCKAHGLLQSTRVASNHNGCCKAQGVLPSTRGAFIYKYMYIYYIYTLYI